MKQTIHTIVIKVVPFLCLSFFSMQLRAQVCYGKYGRPTWIRGFGDGTTPPNSLPPGRTNLLYTSNACPTEGYYTIANNVSPCFSNSWRPEPFNSIRGNMMIINAAASAGEFYVDTIKNLCGNTTYLFGAAFDNVSLPSSCGGQPIKPQLSFRIETVGGSLLALYDAFPLAEGIPTGYNVYFYTQPGPNTVVVKILNNARGGCGNDFVMNNVYVSPCAPEVQAGIVDAGGAFMKLCAGDVSSPVLFAKVGVGYSTPAYQWQRYDGTNWVDIPGENSINYIRRPTGPGNYKYRLFVAESNNSGGDCGVASDEIIIHVRNPGVPGTATNNGPVCENSVVSLSAAGGLSYTWTGPGAFSSNKANPDVIANATSSGQYTVTITDAVGCRSTATTTVRTIKPAVAVSSTQNICQGDAAVLQASGGVAYTWSPANTLSGATFSNPIARPLSTTRYTVKVRDNTNCTDTASVLVVVNTKPAITAGQDKVTVKGYPVTLDGYIQNTGSITYSWLASPTLNDVHLLNPVANPQVNTTYVLTASSGGGCGTSFDTVLVKVYNDLYIPNAFTPNGNGLNDTWHIPALQAFPDAVVSIYNRWGKKIFQRSDSSKEWDGTFQKVPQPPGAYAYIIDLKNNHPLLKGVVVLIR